MFLRRRFQFELRRNLHLRHCTWENMQSITKVLLKVTEAKALS